MLHVQNGGSQTSAYTVPAREQADTCLTSLPVLRDKGQICMGKDNQNGKKKKRERTETHYHCPFPAVGYWAELPCL